ncbi:hypothetical protein ACGFJT_37020 [Actinomadura geliboluensis]|uniref:hypothetical protein n=1 Tax=Actinomadura geliboluensis TaxID=882440 RepID=UPI00371430CE
MGAANRKAKAQTTAAHRKEMGYPTGVPDLDPDTGELIYDAQVAEISAYATYTPFTGRTRAERSPPG